MYEIKENLADKAITIGVYPLNQSKWQVQEYLDELLLLSKTAGYNVIHQEIQYRFKPDVAFYIGKGKLEIIKQKNLELNIKAVIFDNDLSSSQMRNLEKKLDCRIIDRCGLILEIFYKHARTRESKTQVELARLNYLLPRLTGAWTHFSQQSGGIGVKGPGETQLEVDRRLARKRITELQKDLLQIEISHREQRKSREKIFRFALLGYTNSGKSTLMNILTEAGVLAQDNLFATLDTTTRRLQLKKGLDVLLSDTVGFIRKLPPQLVASFRSTLAEIIEADGLLHVIDSSSSFYQDHLKTVNEVISDFKIQHKPTLLIFNKIDRLKETGLLSRLKKEFPEAYFISASKKMGLEELKQGLLHIFENEFIMIKIILTHRDSGHFAKFLSVVEIIKETDTDEQRILDLKVHKKLVNQLAMEFPVQRLSTRNLSELPTGTE